MNGSAWVILGLGAAGFAAFLLFGKQQAAAESAVTSDSGAAPPLGVASMTKVDISNQFKTGAGPMSYSDVLGFASEAGFSGDGLVNIVAVCFAESGGNPDALNSNGTVAPKEGAATDVYSVGLWQINLKAHPKYSAVNLFDPATNAQAAFEVFNAQGLDAWGGYTSGNYSKYLSRVQAAVSA